MLLNRIRNCIRTVVWRFPRLYRPLGLLRRNADVLDLDYDVTVEGYPRSANTFTSELLALTQPHLRVRSHRHIPTHAMAAVRIGVPVFLLIRKPEDCIASYAIMMQTLAKPQLFYYIAYHEALLPYLSRMFIADFEDITTRPKEVLREFARRFGLKVNLDFDADASRAEIFTKIDAGNTSEAGVLDERRVNRPAGTRAPLKAQLIEEMRQAEYRPYVARAEELYAKFRSGAACA